MAEKNVFVTKASGEKELFSPTKLRHSLERAGAASDIVDVIIGEVSKQLVDGISTKKIYSRAFSLLRKHARPAAGKYKIKQAILELGPTGFPFEKFVAEILKHQGYRIKVGVIIQGHCISHEVDVEAEKDKRHIMVECKFHNRQEYKCDVKIPLYIKSRYEDVKKQWEKRKGHASKFHEGWVVTNTRFTEDAIQYGRCSGLVLIGWDYPQRGNILDQITQSGLHPITCLTTLSKAEKQKLIDKMIVLCKELCDRPEMLEEIGLSSGRVSKTVQEGKEICSGSIAHKN